MGILDTTTAFERRLAAVAASPGQGSSPGGPAFPGGAGAAGVEGGGEARPIAMAQAGPVVAPSPLGLRLELCPACKCPIVWWDRYGGGPHCLSCRKPPAPHESFVERWLDVRTVEIPTGEPGGRDRADVVADCPHTSTVLRVVTGGREADSRWRVCRRCGWWERASDDRPTGAPEELPQEAPDLAPGTHAGAGADQESQKPHDATGAISEALAVLDSI
jgi:hypothetical protein